MDEEIFFDFLNGQAAALQEIEAHIPALENGECERLNDIRRRLHTLKGEAGVIGLTDLEYVCHELETILENPRNPKQIIETLLTGKDWMSRAMDRYRAYGLPEPSGRTLIATIRAANQENVEIDPSSDDVIADEPYCLPDDEETNELLADFLTETEERDEASCVVYGMPRAACEEQAVCEVAPLDEILTHILARA